MPAKPHSDKALQDTLEGIKRCGSISAYARSLGLARTTIQSRLREAQERDMMEYVGEPEFISPELESGDEDLDDLMDRLAQEDERKEKARASLEWMEFQVPRQEPFALAFIGDPHADTCAIRLLREHLAIIEDTPRMWAVGLGDWCNAWTGRLRGQYAAQSATERDAYRIVQWMFEKPIWWALLLGNHNGGRWHGDGSPLKWMQTACPTPVQEWQVKFQIKCGKANWRIWAAHNFPGNSIYNANHGPDRRAIFTGAMADLFVAGDRHTYKLSQDQHEHTGNIYWTARAKGYKRFDLYAEELGWSGKQSIGHSVVAVFDPRDGSLHCLPDVARAAQYLEFLRSSL